MKLFLIRQLVFFSFAFVFASLSVLENYSIRDVALLLIVSALLFGTYIFVAWVVLNLYKLCLRTRVDEPVLTILSALLGVFLFICFYAPFLGLSRIEKIALTFLALALFATHEYFPGRARRFVTYFIAIFSVFPLTEIIGIYFVSDHDKSIPLYSNVVPTEKHKNLYIVALDALVSETAYRQIFESKKPLPWQRALMSKDFNFVADATSAGKNTLSSFISLYQGKESNRVVVNRSRFWGGSEGTFFHRTSRLNGYNFSFTFAGTFFGYHSGNYVDDFYPKRRSEVTSLCLAVPWYFAGGLCHIKMIEFAEKNLGLKFDNLEDIQGSLDHFIQSVERSSQSVKPWVNFIYLWSPGHTSSNGDYDYKNHEHRELYFRNYEEAAKNTVLIIEAITREVKMKDPSSILIFFGDHGSYVLRGLNPSTTQTKLLQTLDERGVSLAVYPQDFCSDKFRTNYDLTYLVRDTFSCLGLPLALD